MSFISDASLYFAADGNAFLLLWRRIYDPVDPIQELREHRTLPSDLLRMAQQNNPELSITLDYADERQRLELAVATERGTLRFHREPRERWPDVFRRAGLLQR